MLQTDRKNHLLINFIIWIDADSKYLSTGSIFIRFELELVKILIFWVFWIIIILFLFIFKNAGRQENPKTRCITWSFFHLLPSLNILLWPRRTITAITTWIRHYTTQALVLQVSELFAPLIMMYVAWPGLCVIGRPCGHWPWLENFKATRPGHGQAKAKPRTTQKCVKDLPRVYPSPMRLV